MKMLRITEDLNTEPQIIEETETESAVKEDKEDKEKEDGKEDKQ
jgi:hypothetical protein